MASYMTFDNGKGRDGKERVCPKKLALRYL